MSSEAWTNATVFFYSQDLQYYGVPGEINEDCVVDQISVDEMLNIQLDCLDEDRSIGISGIDSIPLAAGDTVQLSFVAIGDPVGISSFLALRSSEGDLVLGAGYMSRISSPSGRLPEASFYSPISVDIGSKVCGPDLAAANPCATPERTPMVFETPERLVTLFQGETAELEDYTMDVQSSFIFVDIQCTDVPPASFYFRFVRH